MFVSALDSCLSVQTFICKIPVQKQVCSFGCKCVTGKIKLVKSRFRISSQNRLQHLPVDMRLQKPVLHHFTKRKVARDTFSTMANKWHKIINWFVKLALKPNRQIKYCNLHWLVARAPQ